MRQPFGVSAHNVLCSSKYLLRLDAPDLSPIRTAPPERQTASTLPKSAPSHPPPCPSLQLLALYTPQASPRESQSAKKAQDCGRVGFWTRDSTHCGVGGGMAQDSVFGFGVVVWLCDCVRGKSVALEPRAAGCLYCSGVTPRALSTSRI